MSETLEAMLKRQANLLFEAIQILLPECADEAKAAKAMELIKEAARLQP